MAEVLGNGGAGSVKPRAREEWARRMFKGGLEWLVVILVGIAAAFGVKWWMSRDLLPVDGEVVPNITFMDLDGKEHSLGEHLGRPVLLHFWATWCGVCKAEIGTLNELHDEWGEAVDIVAVALRSTAEDIASLVEQEGIRYPVYVAADDVGFQMKIQQFPTTYALDAKGGARARDAGWAPAFRIRWMLEAASEAAK